jgi:acyl dehydratase
MTAPIDAGIVGLTIGPVASAIDARWLMAYAAALGETDERYYDTTAPAGPLAHPLFPVCYEWPAAVALQAKAVDAALAPRSVHARHSLVLHRAPRAGDSLRTTARVIAVRPRRSGTLVVSRYTTTDLTGVRVSTTDYGSLYRGVALAGEPAGELDEGGAGDAGDVRWEDDVAVARPAAHVYTEGARIYNPIHTDVGVARAAGLPAPILHGTATLALAVSRVVARDLDGEPGRVRGVAARFTAMVPLPSTFRVRGRGRHGDRVVFDATAADGAAVLSDGAVIA